MSGQVATVAVRVGGLLLAGMTLAGCGSSLPRLGEAPVGYRAYCEVHPNAQPLVGQNSIRRGCVEVLPADGPARRGVVRTLG